MAKRMTTARKAAVLGLAGAIALAGTAGAAEAPVDFRRINASEIGGTPKNHLQVELNRAADLGNDYLDRSRRAKGNDKLTGGLLIFSGFYGAAVTAFNPAPKNLKAAILGSGTASGLNSGLRFRERSRVYVQGHRAIECVVSTGVPLLSYDPTVAGDLRQKAADALQAGDDALAAKVGAGSKKTQGKGLQGEVRALMEQVKAQAGDARRKTLEERMKVLADLDKALAEEEGSYERLGARVGQTRRQVQDVVDERLAAAAPDYAAVVKAMGETAKPKAAPQPTAPVGVAAAGGEGVAPPDPVEVALVLVNATIRDLQANSPTQATTAFKDMGECVPKAS